MIRLSFAALATCVLLAFFAPRSLAQGTGVPAVHEELARSLFAEGVALSEDGRWGDAAERFTRSLQLFPRSRTALNLAVALVRSGRPVDALAALDRYQLLAVDVPHDELDRATKLREQAEGVVAHVSLETYPVDTELEVDDRPLPHAAKQWVVLDPGRHVIEAMYRGERRKLVLELKAGERVTHEIRWPDLQPPAGSVATPEIAARSLPLAAHEPPRDVQPPARTWKRWVLIGSAVVVVGAAAAITAWAVRRDDSPSAPEPCPDEQVCIL